MKATAKKFESLFYKVLDKIRKKGRISESKTQHSECWKFSRFFIEKDQTLVESMATQQNLNILEKIKRQIFLENFHPRKFKKEKKTALIITIKNTTWSKTLIRLYLSYSVAFF